MRESSKTCKVFAKRSEQFSFPPFYNDDDGNEKKRSDPKNYHLAKALRNVQWIVIN